MNIMITRPLCFWAQNQLYCVANCLVIKGFTGAYCLLFLGSGFVPRSTCDDGRSASSIDCVPGPVCALLRKASISDQLGCPYKLINIIGL